MTPSRRYPRLNDREWLAAQVRAGRSSAEIAAEIGCSAKAVTVELRRHGLYHRPVRSDANPLLADKEWLTRKILDGASRVEVATAARASVGQVRDWVIRHDLGALVDEMRRRQRAGPLTSTEGLVRRLARVEQVVAELAQTIDDLRDQLDRQGGSARVKLSRDWLTQRWVHDAAPVAQIADEAGCAAAAVYRAVHRYGLPLRGQPATKRRGYYERTFTVEYLTAEYVDKQRTAIDIAAEHGCNFSTVYRWLHERGIPVREQHPIRRPDAAENDEWPAAPTPEGEDGGPGQWIGVSRWCG